MQTESGLRPGQPFQDTSALRRGRSAERALHCASRQLEEPLIAVQVEVPICREHRSLKLKRELDRVNGAFELAGADPVSCGSFEHVQPLTLYGRDGVPDNPWSCIEFSHGRREKASARKDTSLHEGNVAIA